MKFIAMMTMRKDMGISAQHAGRLISDIVQPDPDSGSGGQYQSGTVNKIYWEVTNMAELTAKELFRAKNGDGVQNVRDCEGQILRPIAFTTKRYIGQDEKEHEVLIIKDGKTGGMFKTEVRAFIEKYRDYEESFDSEDDEEKPEIVIILNKSKKGNTYVNFDLVGD